MGEAIRGNKAPPAAVPTGVCVRTEGDAGTGRDGTGRLLLQLGCHVRAGAQAQHRCFERVRKLCSFAIQPSVALGLEETTNTRNPEPCRR